MAFLIGVVLMAFASVVQGIPIVNDDEGTLQLQKIARFNTFTATYKKKYSEAEWDMRFNAFVESEAFVEEENSKGYSYEVGLNFFADLRLEEFKRVHLGVHFSDLTLQDLSPPFLHNFTGDVLDLPSNVDWVEAGAVTDVKDQGVCGSCWAFSSTGALEGAWKILSGDLVALSEQELLNCSNGMGENAGCDGGWMMTAFDYVHYQGISTQDAVPYTSYWGTGDGPECDISKATVGIPLGTVTGYAWVESSSNGLMSAVNQQPISVAIQVCCMSFMLYQSGVLFQPECGSDINHGVLVVGYGTEDGNRYWTVKNSWSSDWGLSGYVKLAMDQGQIGGTCAIESYATYPTMTDVTCNK